jgi:hypothetical protein
MLTEMKLGVMGISTIALPVATTLNLPDNMATKGTPYVLAVIVCVLAWAIVKKDKQHRADILDLTKSHQAEIKERDDDHADHLREINTSVQHVLSDTASSIGEFKQMVSDLHGYIKRNNGGK